MSRAEYEKDFGVGSVLRTTAKLYRNIAFRPNIVLMMDDHTFIGDNCTILVPKLTMMEGSQINANTVLAGREEIVLEEDVVVSYGCRIFTTTDTPHGRFMNDATLEKDDKGTWQRDIIFGRVLIKKGCFIGANTIIMPRVKIGRFSVIGAGSYINKNILPYRVVIPEQKLITKHRREYWKDAMEWEFK